MPDCALCHGGDASPIPVAPRAAEVALCLVCRAGVEQGPQDSPHWQCLNEAIWSVEPAEQVLAWRLLTALAAAPWAREVLEIAQLDPETLRWAEAVAPAAAAVIHRDSNGAVLNAGDTVTLIKDLPVKGAGFVAKRGTAVRNISLVPDNAGQIEGRVEGQRIVILTEFTKRA